MAVQELFDESRDWMVSSEEVAPVYGNNRMALIVPGQANRIIVSDPQAVEQPDRYVYVEIPEVSGSSGWQVGIVAGQQNDDAYYLYSFNHLGQWRFTANEGDSEQVIRDWSTHPAILPGTIEFSIGLLMREDGFDFFYNHQLIGRLTDDTIDDLSLMGLMVQPPSGTENDVIAQFQNWTITVPAGDAAFIPDMIASGDSTVTVQELQRRRLIPMLGAFGLIVPESFVTYNRPGVNHIRLGGDQEFEHFALGASVTWEIATPALPAGCGLTLDVTGENDYMLAYFDQTGAAGLSQREGDTFEAGVFQEGFDATTGLYRLLVIADDDRLLYYVNGQLVGTLARANAGGGVGNATVNFEPTTTSCQFCRYLGVGLGLNPNGSHHAYPNEQGELLLIV